MNSNEIGTIRVALRLYQRQLALRYEHASSLKEQKIYTAEDRRCERLLKGEELKLKR